MTLEKFGIGQSVRRLEDLRFLRGLGRYVDDDQEPEMLHAVFLRSPHAHADIRAVDVSQASAAPGVVAVFTGGPDGGRQLVDTRN